MSAAAAQQKQHQTIKVKAYSTEHARRVASSLTGFSMESITQVAPLKKPRQGKTCTTEDFPVKGARKWVTKYNIYAYGNKVAIGRNRYEYTNMEFVKGGFDTKTEAVKIAREMAIKHQLPMTVQIAKELQDESPHVTDLEPNTTVGEYNITFYV